MAVCALRKEEARPGPSAETVERVRETFVRSPQKSTTRASREFQVGQKLGEILYLLIFLVAQSSSEIPEGLMNNPVFKTGLFL